MSYSEIFTLAYKFRNFLWLYKYIIEPIKKVYGFIEFDYIATGYIFWCHFFI